MQNIVLVRACGISQIKHRNIVAVILFGDSSVISRHISLCVCTDKRHSRSTGKLYIRIQKVSGLADSCGADHKSMHITVIHKSNSLFARTSAPNHRTLNSRKIFTFTPFLRLKWQRDKSTLYLSFCRPPRSSVLSIADFFCLYSVKRLVVKQIYDYQKCDKKYNQYAY